MNIKIFLKEKGIYDLPPEKRMVRLVHAVAGIPWGEARSVEEVLSMNKGTCTGKHKVLQAAFDELGLPYSPVVCTFRWGEQGIAFPEHLKKILAEGEWEHGHNFVQIPRVNGEKIDLDITWNPALRPYGFGVLPDDWEGNSSFVGLKKIVQRWDGAEIDEMKKELIANLTPEMRERRERFLKGFIEWVDSINSQ